MSESSPIAFLGLGSMGERMAARLQDAGHPLAAWNRTPARANDLVATGARLAGTPAEAVAESRVAFLMLADPAAVRQVLDGPDGALRAARPGTIIVDCSTIGPDDARAWAVLCEAAGGRYVESPVLGSLRQAESGALVERGFANEDFAAVREAVGKPNVATP